MDSEKVDALIRELQDRRAKNYDLTFAAGPGETDLAIIEAAARAAERVAEYDSLLAIVRE
jgi:hypothetical protein